MIKIFILLTFLAISCQTKENTMLLNSLFSDGMVLQQKEKVAFWGTSKPNQKVEVIGSWGTKSETTSDNDGEWVLYLDTPKAGGPFNIIVSSGSETITINDVLIGEVWLAAGQSNMEMTFDYCCNTTDKAQEVISNTNTPEIRMFNVQKQLSYTPLNNLEGKWEKAIGPKVSSFSAVGYFFAKNLYDELNVPIGIIHASWGGSRAEAWTSHTALAALKGYQKPLEGLKKESQENQDLQNWLKKHKSTPLPSSGWDLFLAEYLKSAQPEIEYMSYFIDNWKSLDYLGMNNIKNPNKNKEWMSLDSNGSTKNGFMADDFRGVVLFKNSLLIENNKQNLYLEIKPEDNMPFDMWDYDIFFNGHNVGSTLIDVDPKDYTFIKKPQVFHINPKLVREGENQIIVRTLGQPNLGNISISTDQKKIIAPTENWSMIVIGEEFFQIENYQYPYMSLFNYEDKKIDFSKIPPKKYLTHRTLGSLFNGMLYPIIPFTMKGSIWYQGESNVEVGGPNFSNYLELIPAMVKDWRARWGNDFPFYYAQVAPYYNYQGMLPHFQSAQSSFLTTIPNTEMIVTSDIGENYDIHPSNKHDVGYRFSQFALRNEYKLDIKAGGPIYSHSEIDGSKIKIYFKSGLAGLSIKSNQSTGFEISGIKKEYLHANVNIVDDYLEVFSEKVKNPIYVRYAWSDTATAILFNLNGWPASSFTTE